MNVSAELTAENQLYELLDVVRNTMCRNFAGIDNPRLYNTALTGTKLQIEEFREAVTKSLQYILDHPTFEDKLVFFNVRFSSSNLPIISGKLPYVCREEHCSGWHTWD